MMAGPGKLNDHGFTLVELLIVLVIIGILAVALAFEYKGWEGSYRVEGEVKQMYADFMNARAMALARSRMFFINVPASNGKRYYVYEDTDGGINGDQALDTAHDKMITNGLTQDAFSPAHNLGVNSKGLITNGTDILREPEYVHFVLGDSVEPDYDCIELTATRIKMGLWNGTACATK